MTSLNRIRLPRHITGARPSGAPDTLRTVRPRFLAPSPTDTKATSRAVGSHVVRLPRGFEARPTKIDGVDVLVARSGQEVHVFVDNTDGVVEVVGWSAEQVGAMRDWMDAAAVDPANLTELERVLDRIDARTPGRIDLDPTDKSRDTQKALKLLGLTATEGQEVDRLVALAAALDDGTAGGDAEVDRLVRIADGLSDG